jgi:transmembrane protein EpsG
VFNCPPGFLSYPKRNAWIYHILFMAMLMFFSFNGIRQAISVVFIMLAIKYELENRTLILFILVFFASLFHQSAIFLVPAILFSKIPLSYKIKEVVFPLIITGVTAFIWLGASTFSIAENIVGKLDLPYQHYFESSYFETANINTGYLVLTKALLALILLLNSSKLLRVSENNWPIIVYTGFFIVFYSLASQSAAFGRLSYVYTPGVIYFLYLFISNYSKKSNTWFLFTFLTFFAYVLPYVTTSLSTINNPNNDNSYQTIFNKRF